MKSQIESLTVPPVNFVEIGRGILKIQDVKVVGSLHEPYGKCTDDPLIFSLGVCTLVRDL